MKDANLSSQAAEQSVIRLIVDDATSSAQVSRQKRVSGRFAAKLEEARVVTR